MVPNMSPTLQPEKSWVDRRMDGRKTWMERVEWEWSGHWTPPKALLNPDSKAFSTQELI